MAHDSRSAGRPRRGQRTVDTRMIGVAAVEVLRQEGAASLTISRVAAHLGIRSQTLYYHVATLSDVVNAARGVLIAGADPTMRPGESWEGSVARFVEEYYDAFRPLAQGNSVFFSHAITNAETLQAYDRFLVQAQEAGVPGTDSLQLLLDLEHTIFSLIFEYTSWHGLFSLEAIDASGATTLKGLLHTRNSTETALRERVRSAALALTSRALTRAHATD